MTGVISGTPTAAVATGTYQVTASNAGGEHPRRPGDQRLASPVGAVFPLAISASRNGLVDASGRPFLVQGDAAWSAIAELSEADALLYLDDRQGRGFNAILVNLVEHSLHLAPPAAGERRGQRCPSPAPSPDSARAGGTTGCNDLSTPNDAYFQHVDWFLEQARQRGMLVLLAPAYIGYKGERDRRVDQRDASPPGRRNSRPTASTSAPVTSDVPNILWVQGGDYTPSSSQVPLVQRPGRRASRPVAGRSSRPRTGAASRARSYGPRPGRPGSTSTRSTSSPRRTTTRSGAGPATFGPRGAPGALHRGLVRGRGGGGPPARPRRSSFAPTCTSPPLRRGRIRVRHLSDLELLDGTGHQPEQLLRRIRRPSSPTGSRRWRAPAAGTRAMARTLFESARLVAPRPGRPNGNRTS